MNKFKLVNGQTLGLSLLSAEAAFAEWSALLPSFFTVAKFADTPSDMDNIRQSILIALGVMGVTAVGIRLAFGKKGTVPALAHLGTGVGLATIYGFKIGWNKLLNPSTQSF